MTANFIEQYVEDVLRRKILPGKTVFMQLAAQMYEKRPMHGTICFITQDIKLDCILSEEFLNLEGILRENRKINIKNFRELRKLMEMNTEDTCMMAVTGEDFKFEPVMLGIASQSWMKTRKEKLKNCVQITFQGYLKWTFSIDGNAMFFCDNGTIKLYLEGGMEKRLKETLNDICLGDKKKKIIDIIKLLYEKQKHGTSIIFMENDIVRIEAKRLEKANRCIRISKEGEKKV